MYGAAFWDRHTKDSDEYLITDQKKVVEKLTFYINITQNIGIHATKQNNETHSSIQKIKSKHGQLNNFHFTPVTDGLGCSVANFWEIAAHSVNDMFSLYFDYL